MTKKISISWWGSDSFGRVAARELVGHPDFAVVSVQFVRDRRTDYEPYGSFPPRNSHFIQMSGCYFEDSLQKVGKRGYDGFDSKREAREYELELA